MVPPVLVEERRNRLLELVRVRGFASLPELAEPLQVSESTIRRDLDYLEESGTARRTHGGVFYTGQLAQAAALRRAAAGPVGQEASDRRSRRRADRGRRHDAAGWRQHDLRGGPAAGRPAAARGDQLAAGGQPVRRRAPTATWCLIGGYVYPRTGVSAGTLCQRDAGDGSACGGRSLSVAGDQRARASSTTTCCWSRPSGR